MAKINQEEYEVLKPKLEEEYTHVGKSRDGKLQFLQGYIERDMKREEWSDGWGQTYMRPVNLFQFIQWEDEEPYNIAELIEEYERGGIEVNKDKLWAKNKIQEELESWRNIEGGIDEDGINYVLNIIDQIDEPEVLTQE